MNSLIALLCLLALVGLGGLLILAALSVRLVPDHQRLVVFRSGRVVGARGPGLAFVVPLVEQAVGVEMREQMRSEELAPTRTRDTAFVTAKLDYYFKVIDPPAAVMGPATDESLLPAALHDELAAAVRAQTLAEVLGNPQLAEQVRSRLAARCQAWGIELTQLHLREVRNATGA